MELTYVSLYGSWDLGWLSHTIATDCPLVRAKMQFATKLMALSLFPRRFLATASKKKVISSSKKSNSKKTPVKQGTKVPVHDISKMPQPHPVLTPSNRNNKNNLISESIPSIESFKEALANNIAAVVGYKIEIDTELQKRLPRNVSEVCTHFGGNYFILRPELLKSITTAMHENDKIVIDGPNGAGKSIALMQLFASFNESIRNDGNKICLYAPNVHKWTTGYFAYYPQETTASSFIQPELALEILKLLVVCNKGKSGLLGGLEGEIVEAQLDSFNRAIPLYQRTMNNLIEKGIELTMFLDGVNGLIDENSLTAYLDKEGKQVPLSSLPLCSQIYSMNGIKVVGAMTRSNPALPSDPSFPPSINQLSVPNYCPDDFKRVLQLYSQLGHCSSNNTDQFFAFKSFVSGSNGRKLFKICEYDSIYYKN